MDLTMTSLNIVCFPVSYGRRVRIMAGGRSFQQNEGAQKLHRELTNHKARLPIGEISDLLSRGGSAFGIPYGTMK